MEIDNNKERKEKENEDRIRKRGKNEYYIFINR